MVEVLVSQSKIRSDIIPLFYAQDTVKYFRDHIILGIKHAKEIRDTTAENRE